MTAIKIENYLSRIAKHLIINSSFMDNIGLYNGKMGIVLFFAHLANYTRKDIYNDFASKLLDEIYGEIHIDTPINFKDGLCGIGWGIEYLLHYRFLEGDSNEILASIDEKIMERNPLRIKDESIETGKNGILYYILTRLISYNRPKNDIPFDIDYLNNWIFILNQEEKETTNILTQSFLKWMKNEEINLNLQNFLITNIIKSNEIYDEEFIYLSYGLVNGSAGIGIKNMLL
jgi:hypothetical protein